MQAECGIEASLEHHCVRSSHHNSLLCHLLVRHSGLVLVSRPQLLHLKRRKTLSQALLPITASSRQSVHKLMPNDTPIDAPVTVTTSASIQPALGIAQGSVIPPHVLRVLLATAEELESESANTRSSSNSSSVGNITSVAK